VNEPIKLQYDRPAPGARRTLSIFWRVFFAVFATAFTVPAIVFLFRQTERGELTAQLILPELVLLLMPIALWSVVFSGRIGFDRRGKPKR
jgi:hypothetical protein